MLIKKAYDSGTTLHEGQNLQPGQSAHHAKHSSKSVYLYGLLRNQGPENIGGAASKVRHQNVQRHKLWSGARRARGTRARLLYAW